MDKGFKESSKNIAAAWGYLSISQWHPPDMGLWKSCSLCLESLREDSFWIHGMQRLSSRELAGSKEVRVNLFLLLSF